MTIQSGRILGILALLACAPVDVEAQYSFDLDVPAVCGSPGQRKSAYLIHLGQDP